MCLIALSWRAHPRWSLVLAANRDEFHNRPTLPVAPWTERPEILGGRDLAHGGSWLALRGRRLAAVTNVREAHDATGRSRGDLVAAFVGAASSARAFAEVLAGDAGGYRPFNLLLHDGADLVHASNRPGYGWRVLEPGIHGVSNGAIDAAWPKVDALRGVLSTWTAQPSATPDPPTEPLFGALADRQRAPDERLPDTGVGLDRERLLSAAFIAGGDYGTRASTVVLIGADEVRVEERRFGPGGAPGGVSAYAMRTDV